MESLEPVHVHWSRPFHERRHAFRRRCHVAETNACAILAMRERESLQVRYECFLAVAIGQGGAESDFTKLRGKRRRRRKRRRKRRGSRGGPGTHGKCITQLEALDMASPIHRDERTLFFRLSRLTHTWVIAAAKYDSTGTCLSRETKVNSWRETSMQPRPMPPYIRVPQF